MREKLIELLKYIGDNILRFNKGKTEGFTVALADHLIANGVTIPVRCKDCKSCMFCYPEKKNGKEPTPGWYCKEQKGYRRPDDFCSYGERRTDV